MNAALELEDVSIGQSKPRGSNFSNQINALILGKNSGSCVSSMSLIHAAFEPPYSVDAVSATMSGFKGATVPVITV